MPQQLRYGWVSVGKGEKARVTFQGVGSPGCTGKDILLTRDIWKKDGTWRLSPTLQRKVPKK